MAAKESNPALCAIVSRNYFPYAKNMVRSYLNHHPNTAAYVLLYDAPQMPEVRSSEPFTVISAGEMQSALPEYRDLAFRYRPLQLACALKPYFLSYVFERFGHSRLIYSDSDIQYFSPIKKILSALKDHSIVLTPHLVTSADLSPEIAIHNERSVLLSGMYNAGLVGVRSTDIGRRFLAWWKDRVRTSCDISVVKGTFLDQRWLDFAPGIFGDIHLERGIEFNVGFWNLYERHLSKKKNRYFCQDTPLSFFHFSHVNLSHFRRLTPIWRRHGVRPDRTIVGLISEYKENLLEHGYTQERKLPYGFDRFDNGVLIPDCARILYLNVSRSKRFPDPFRSAEKGSFYQCMLRADSGGVSPLAAQLLVLNHKANLRGKEMRKTLRQLIKTAGLDPRIRKTLYEDT